MKLFLLLLGFVFTIYEHYSRNLFIVYYHYKICFTIYRPYAYAADPFTMSMSPLMPDAYDQMGQRFRPSHLDIQKLIVMYNCMPVVRKNVKTDIRSSKH